MGNKSAAHTDMLMSPVGPAGSGGGEVGGRLGPWNPGDAGSLQKSYERKPAPGWLKRCRRCVLGVLADAAVVRSLGAITWPLRTES